MKTDQHLYTRRELELAIQGYSALRNPCRTVANYEAQYGGKHDWTELVAVKSDLDQALDALGRPGAWQIVCGSDVLIRRGLRWFNVQQLCVVGWYLAPYKAPVDGLKAISAKDERMRRLGEVLDWVYLEHNINQAQRLMDEAFSRMKRFLNKDKPAKTGRLVKCFEATPGNGVV